MYVQWGEWCYLGIRQGRQHEDHIFRFFFCSTSFPFRIACDNTTMAAVSWMFRRCACMFEIITINYAWTLIIAWKSYHYFIKCVINENSFIKCDENKKYSIVFCKHETNSMTFLFLHTKKSGEFIIVNISFFL